MVIEGNRRSFKHISINIKWTVSIISRDPYCKEGNTRFTTVPFKPLTVYRVERSFHIKTHFRIPLKTTVLL